MKYIKTFENTTAKYYIYPVKPNDLTESLHKFIDKNKPFILRALNNKFYYIQFNYKDAFYPFDILNYSFSVEEKDLHRYGKEFTYDEAIELLQTIKFNI